VESLGRGEKLLKLGQLRLMPKSSAQSSAALACQSVTLPIPLGMQHCLPCPVPILVGCARCRVWSKSPQPLLLSLDNELLLV
jgi:hypothetical protein